jgi:hypothetical protein
LQEIADNPEFFVGDATRFDVQQGELGECVLKVGCVNKFNCLEVI